MKLQFLTATTAVALCAALPAQSPLTTLTGGTQFAGWGSAIYFDLTAGSSGLQIDAFDFYYFSGAGTTVSIDVYVRTGTHAGFESSPMGWSFVTSDVGGLVAAGPTLPTNTPLALPFCIPAGTTTGVAIVCNATSPQYTTGSGSPCTNCSYSNADLTFDGGSVTLTPFSGSVFSPRVANAGIYYTLSAGCSLRLPPGIAGVVESAPFTGTLDTANQLFRDGDFVRWNYTDPNGSNAGLFGIVVANLAVGGAPAVGVTPQIPGFDQLWAGSNPSGIADIFPPGIVGAPDAFVVIPSGLFTHGDSFRIQGLVLDPSVRSAFPVIPTSNTMLFTKTDCAIDEGFENVATGVGNYPTNWSNGGGTQEWRVNSGSTGSAGTGPTAAFGGSNYMYCETSSPSGTGDTYIMNTDTYATSGLSALEFQLSRVGATIGVLEVRMDDGSGTFSTVLATYTGSGLLGQQWTLESVALPSPAPANVQFQFHYTRGTSFTGDLAIDDFCLR